MTGGDLSDDDGFVGLPRRAVPAATWWEKSDVSASVGPTTAALLALVRRCSCGSAERDVGLCGPRR